MLRPMLGADSSRHLPLAQRDPLEFHCNRCGVCCKTLRVALTHHDLRRLVHALGRPAASLVEWLPPHDVDMAGEPASFLELSEGRRLMVLAHAGGACQLFDARTSRCMAYAARPRDCALFPFDLARDARGEVKAVSLLELEGCSQERGPRAHLGELSSSDGQRWAELADYQTQVRRWNRLARHRQRFRRPAGNTSDVLSFFGF